MAWRADSYHGECAVEVFGNSKKRAVNFFHSMGQGQNDLLHTSMQGKGVTRDPPGTTGNSISQRSSVFDRAALQGAALDD